MCNAFKIIIKFKIRLRTNIYFMIKILHGVNCEEVRFFWQRKNSNLILRGFYISKNNKTNREKNHR